MNVEQTIEQITDYDVVDILTDLGSDEPSFVRDGMLFNTICHNEPGFGKKKLHYHSETKTFFCYTECHNIGNIFRLVMKVRDCSFRDAYEYVCLKLGISTTSLKYGFSHEKSDNSFIRKFNKQSTKKEEIEIRDKSVLNRFWSNLFHESWIKDNISIEVMKECGIRYDIYENRIIIPHFDENDNLIGVRCRYLDAKKVEEGKKYMPITVDNVLYNYPTSLNLYGLNFNKNNIKKYKKVIIGESEKFVMQHKTYYEDSVAVAISGSFISNEQIEILKRYEVDEVIIALDKEFETEEEEKTYMEKVQYKFVNPLCKYFTVSILWDIENDLELKDAPTDKGKEIFEKIYRNRISV